MESENKGTRIILLEDDVVAHHLWKAILKRTCPGGELQWFTDVSTALREIEDKGDRGIDLIIIDIFLSGDDTGIDFIEKVATPLKNKLVVSSGASEESVGEYLRFLDGEFIFIKKPLDVKICENILLNTLLAKRLELNMAGSNELRHRA